MPTYQYLCKYCGHEHEEFQSITAEHLVVCPHCGTPNLARMMGTGGGLIFKGSGFYLTDYKKSPGSGENKESGEKNEPGEKQGPGGKREPQEKQEPGGKREPQEKQEPREKKGPGAKKKPDVKKESAGPTGENESP